MDAKIDAEMIRVRRGIFLDRPEDLDMAPVIMPPGDSRPIPSPTKQGSRRRARPFTAAGVTSQHECVQWLKKRGDFLNVQPAKPASDGTTAEDCKELFQLVDEDAVGKVSFAEVMTCLRRCGIRSNRADVQNLLFSPHPGTREKLNLDKFTHRIMKNSQRASSSMLPVSLWVLASKRRQNFAGTFSLPELGIKKKVVNMAGFLEQRATRNSPKRTVSTAGGSGKGNSISSGRERKVPVGKRTKQLEKKKALLYHTQEKLQGGEKYYALEPKVRDILYGRVPKPPKKHEVYDAQAETELLMDNAKYQLAQMKHTSPWADKKRRGSNSGGQTGSARGNEGSSGERAGATVRGANKHGPVLDPQEASLLAAEAHFDRVEGETRSMLQKRLEAAWNGGRNGESVAGAAPSTSLSLPSL
jgi:hypothetical protein